MTPTFQCRANVSLGHQRVAANDVHGGLRPPAEPDSVRGQRAFSRQGGNARIPVTYELRVSACGSGTAIRRSRTRRSSTGIDSHNMDTGVDYTKALSFSRRTTLASRPARPRSATDRRDQVSGNGNANLNHELGRTWMAIASLRSIRAVRRHASRPGLLRLVRRRRRRPAERGA